ncbi:hypothetical protein [Paraburkholderia sp. RL17-337-BIB-A]|uniref:hypothetical protein n=1 Tax=Paraburkholderia sp. RL17-337-BIB-A TaxID=3031636 RepID=UPI0038BC48E5
MAIDEALACCGHLSKQHNRTRFRAFPVLVERRLRLLSPLNHSPPLRAPDFLSVSAALRERARNNVEVFERTDDLEWRHDATFSAVRSRVRHQHALDRSASGAIAEPVPEEVMSSAEERAQWKTLARRGRSGLGSGVWKVPVKVAHMGRDKCGVLGIRRTARVVFCFSHGYV